MSKNILIISTSLRKGSNSEMLAGGLTALRKPAFFGTVFAGGVDAAGEAKGHASLRKAFELGRNI